jgi:hypothetical protein
MISREQIVEQSIEKFLRAVLTSRGYAEAEVALIDSFPATRGKLDKTYVAAGFNFDTGGDQAEMGSDLTRRQYTIEFFVFGTTGTWAKNVASVVKFGLESDPNGVLPLYDIEGGTDAIVDYLLVDGATTEHQPIPEPEPWQEHVWTVHLKVTDEYYASLAV